MNVLRRVRKAGTVGGLVAVTLCLSGFVYGLRKSSPNSTRADVGRAAVSAVARPPGVTPLPARDGVLASATPLTAEQLFAFASPSVATVEARDGQMRLVGRSTGFFVPGDGLLVTNSSSIDGASFASVRTADGQMLFVDGIVATDRPADLALLKVRGGSAQPVLRLATEPAPRAGTQVFAVGNAQGLTNTLSEGLVGSRRAAVNSGSAAATPVARKAVSTIQTSAAISPGSSGGPLMTADGAVVGVTSASLAAGQGLHVAAPAERVRQMIAGRRGVTPMAVAAARLIDPADARAYAALFAAMDDARIRDAVAILKSMTDRQKQNPFYWFTAGCVHQRLLNSEIAARYFQKSVELQSTFTEAHVRLAEVLADDGKLDQAEAVYDRVLKANPRDVAALRGRAQLHAEKAEYALAVKALDDALKIEPRSVELLAMKGVVYGRTRRPAEAIATFNAALKLDPADVMTRVRFGEALIQIGRPKSALIPLKKAIELAPDNAWAYYLVGEASHALKDDTAARLAWRNARRFDPYGPAGGVAAERLAGDRTAFLRVGVY